MTTIPKDIWRAANECVRESFAAPLSPIAGHVARAILAERKRCAEVARQEGERYRAHNLPVAAMGAFHAAKAIEATPCA